MIFHGRLIRVETADLDPFVVLADTGGQSWKKLVHKRSAKAAKIDRKICRNCNFLQSTQLQKLHLGAASFPPSDFSVDSGGFPCY